MNDETKPDEGMSDEEFNRLLLGGWHLRCLSMDQIMDELARSRAEVKRLDLENRGLKLGKMACEAEIAELKKMIEQYRDGRTHDEIQEHHRLQKENAKLRAKVEELQGAKDCGHREVMKTLNYDVCIVCGRKK